jgi:hypothetical protein
VVGGAQRATVARVHRPDRTRWDDWGVAECEHRECNEEAVPDMRFCHVHMEGLHFLFSQLEIRCPRCGAWSPEGLLWHDCANPSPQPPAEEM